METQSIFLLDRMFEIITVSPTVINNSQLEIDDKHFNVIVRNLASNTIVGIDRGLFPTREDAIAAGIAIVMENQN